MDKKSRKVLLKPLSRRRQYAADRKALIAALDRLDIRYLAKSILPQVRDDFSEMRKSFEPDSWKDPNIAAKWAELAHVLYISRQISRQEYVMLAASSVEGVHEGRIIDGYYDSALGPINKELEEVRNYEVCEADEQDYKDAEAIYLALLSTLGHIRSIPRGNSD